ncbi:MAG: cupredoxin domain-containing protein [bacterium]|nr:cupredoxin domain-containing protein [bacterium]
MDEHDHRNAPSRKTFGRKTFGSKTLITTVFSAAAALSIGLAATTAAARAGEIDQTVKMVFTKATVAGVPTISVNNLPADVVARAGDTVVLTIVNQSPLPEGFSIDAYNVHDVIKPKATATVRLTGVKAGSYPIYCQLHPYSVHHLGTLLVAAH